MLNKEKVLLCFGLQVITLSCFSYYKNQSSLIKKNFKSIPPQIKIRVLKKDPFICRLENFITDAEAEHLKRIAANKLERSRVGIEGGGIEDSRTSSSAMFHNRYDDTIQLITTRATDMVGYPFFQAEGLQVVRYQKGEEFKPHLDAYTDDQKKEMSGSQRVMTFFIYLNDVKQSDGGETEFPKLSLKVKPKKNSAVFWVNLDKDGKNDERMLHAGLPPKSGEKWGANLWVLSKPY